VGGQRVRVGYWMDERGSYGLVYGEEGDWTDEKNNKND